MRDLSLYRPVSNLPAITRDLSIAVDADVDTELLGDRVREALGADADCVEAVEVLSETPGSELPPVARQRLELQPGQKNVLLRVVLRHAERTLTREEANDVRERVVPRALRLTADRGRATCARSRGRSGRGRAAGARSRPRRAAGASSAGASTTSLYGTLASRWAMQLRRARRLSSASTTYHGASGMSVCTNISSLAFENSTHRCRDSMSMGESFQRRIGSLVRERKRRSCSSSLTENQYFSKMMPSSTSMRSNSGHWCRKRRYSVGVQNPMTCSTPARVYHDRSNSTMCPADGRCST